MWFDTDAQDRWTDAVAHLRKDRKLRPVIDRVGPCTLKPRRDYFVKLIQSILSQQVSVAAAASMYRKLSLNFVGKKPTPAEVVRFIRESDEQTIRACGLSRQKRAYVLDLAERFHSGEIQSRHFSRMSDDQIVDSLTHIKGIGRWTVEMLLIFALNRPDVWPVDDLGIREGVRLLEGLEERPSAKELRGYAEHWRPYRSVASWYLWRIKSGPAVVVRPIKSPGKRLSRRA